MYCPKCATQNMENAKFCRSCGSDISLVPMALTGRLAQEEVARVEDEKPSRHRRKKKKDEPTYDKAFENVGVGIAFLIISVLVALYMPAGRFWWFWLLIPTFACFGEAIGQFIRLRRQLPPAASSTEELPGLTHEPLRVADLHPRNTSEIMAPPPSVTEGTTRHLGAEAPTKDLQTPVDNPDR